VGTGLGLLVHVLPGLNTGGTCKPRTRIMILSSIREQNNPPGRLVRSRYVSYSFYRSFFFEFMVSIEVRSMTKTQFGKA
jgi:hypothetical protein